MAFQRTVWHAKHPLRSIYNDVSALCGKDGQVAVDLGLVNKTDYYTGIIIKGYLQGHGAKVLSGGRYDKLISEFGYDVPAVGFAVDVNAVSKVIAKNGDINSYRPVSDVIVYSAPGNEIKGIKTANKLRAKGDIVENSLFETLDATREYAREKKIAKIVVVEEDIDE